MFGNLQRIASRYIPQQSVQWYRFQSNESDELGQKQSHYHDPITIRGSWQAIDTQDVKEMGLDTTKVYRKFYTSHYIRHIQRGRSADFLVVAGRRYQP